MQNSFVPVLLGRPIAENHAAPHDVRCDGNRFDVVHGRGAAIEADVGWKWRLQPRHAFLAFEAFEQRSLFAADVGAGAVMEVKVEIPAMDIALADQPRLVGLVDRGLQALALADELAADVDVAGVRAHREAGDQAALDEKMRIVPHDLAILAGARLGLIGVHDQVVRPAVFRLLRHERPFETGREAGAAAPTQARGLDLIDDAVAALLQDRLGAVPSTARARTFKAPVVEAVEILEDAVLIVEHGYDAISDGESVTKGAISA
jgi:hypothetical protein